MDSTVPFQLREIRTVPDLGPATAADLVDAARQPIKQVMTTLGTSERGWTTAKAATRLRRTTDPFRTPATDAPQA